MDLLKLLIITIIIISKKIVVHKNDVRVPKAELMVNTKKTKRTDAIILIACFVLN